MQRFPGVTQAKAALMEHIPRLVLTPGQTAEGPVFEVSGSLNLAAGEEYVTPAVAWDGIEQPPLVFLGLRSRHCRFILSSS